jgi:hypothetical protein
MDGAFRRSTESQLIIGGFLIFLVLGGGLAWLLFGRTVALIAGGIMVGGMVLLAVLWLVIHLLESWARNG